MSLFSADCITATGARPPESSRRATLSYAENDGEVCLRLPPSRQSHLSAFIFMPNPPTARPVSAEACLLERLLASLIGPIPCPIELLGGTGQVNPPFGSEGDFFCSVTVRNSLNQGFIVNTAGITGLSESSNSPQTNKLSLRASTLVDGATGAGTLNVKVPPV